MNSNRRYSGIALVQLLLMVVVLGLLAAVGYLLLNPDMQGLSGEVSAPGQEVKTTSEQASLMRQPVVAESSDQQADESSLANPAVQRVTPSADKPRLSALTGRAAIIDSISESQLPGLNDSDAGFRQALLDLSGSSLLAEWLISEELIRKLVVTIDNMAEGRLVRKHSLLEPMTDKFRPSLQGEQLWLDGYNFSRYQPYVQVFEAIDIRRWVGLYQHYYPLMQQAYVELGYPRKAFHDRVLLALDQLLASPVIPRALSLSQPSVMYTFSDPELEKLPAVHKQLLRIGPAHSARLLERLTLLRAELIKL